MRTLFTFIILLANTLATFSASPSCKLLLEYKLHGQTRRFTMTFNRDDKKGMTIDWGIERNLKWWSGQYVMTPEAVKSANLISYLMPEDKNHIQLPDSETFAMISLDALEDLRKKGKMIYNNTEFIVSDSISESPLGKLFHVSDIHEDTEMWVADNDTFPIIWEMKNNPLEINWKAKIIEHP